MTVTFVENDVDYRRSRDRGMERAELGDEQLEICPYCMCEVDVEPQPHQPECPGIGAPRVSSEPVLANAESVRRVEEELLRLQTDEEVLEEREPQTSVEPVSALSAIEPPVAPSRSSSANPYGLKKFGRGYVWTVEAALAAVCAFVDEHGRSPVPMDGLAQPHGSFPSAKSVSNLFASWDAMIVAAGFTPAERGAPREGLTSARWSRESAIEAIQAYVREHGVPPAQDKIAGTGLPGKKPAQRLFGGWLKMLEAAGVELTVAMVRGSVIGGKAARVTSQEREPERLGPDDSRSSNADTAAAPPSLEPVRLAALAAINAVFALLEATEAACVR